MAIDINDVVQQCECCGEMAFEAECEHCGWNSAASIPDIETREHFIGVTREKLGSYVGPKGYDAPTRCAACGHTNKGPKCNSCQWDKSRRYMDKAGFIAAVRSHRANKEPRHDA